MRAQDIMSTPVVTVGPEAPAKQAAALLSAHGFTALPVVDEDDRLIGIVTEADLIADRVPPDIRFRAADTTARRGGETVADVMTSPCTGMAPGTDVALLARTLLEDRIRVMPIVEGSRVIGVVTRGDIVRTFARQDSEIAAEVRRHLAIYGGPDRWKVEVHDGKVRIVDAFDDETDRHVATLLAEAVPGVVSAQVSTVVS
ncbi:CBS domain-containing protein [Amycolatopsis pigmentata]|uniref:HPP family protein n=1 Tax=Amycolatopsis pigmentata TaxID=450801 RepID=A0ABW5FY12_9PSEU